MDILNPMDIMEPINLSSIELDESQPFTSMEMAKLWATYMGNSMSTQILTYFFQHCEDVYIRKIVKNALTLSKDFKQRVEVFLKKENFSIPVGFTQDDVI